MILWGREEEDIRVNNKYLCIICLHIKHVTLIITIVIVYLYMLFVEQQPQDDYVA